MAKRKEKEENLGTMSVPQLEARLRETEESLFRLRFRHSNNPIKNPMQIRQERREIARIKTWMRQKAQGAA